MGGVRYRSNSSGLPGDDVKYLSYSRARPDQTVLRLFSSEGKAVLARPEKE